MLCDLVLTRRAGFEVLEKLFFLKKQGKAKNKERADEARGMAAPARLSWRRCAIEGPGAAGPFFAKAEAAPDLPLCHWRVADGRVSNRHQRHKKKERG